MTFTRISVRPEQWAACLASGGPVATVVGMAADRMTEAEILAALPDLEADDIRERSNQYADRLFESMSSTERHE